MNETDEELASCIESTIAESNGDYVAALDKVIEWMKKTRGLKGFHVGTSLDVLCGQRKVEDPAAEANRVAESALNMMLASAKGELKEVTHEELEVM